METQTVSAMQAGLQSVLEPFDAGDFMDKYWGYQYLHIHGTEQKFSNLLPWDALNSILNTHRLTSPRLRLVKNGMSIDPDTYTYYDSIRSKEVRSAIPRINVASFTRSLQDGATLILNSVDELYDPLTNLALALERTLHERVGINLYAASGTDQGFDVHWDDHDVFVLQLAGRKNWCLYGVTTKAPLTGQRPPLPTSEPIYSCTLNTGDVLYMPRGVWHAARPIGELSAHLSVGITKRTGVNVLLWLIEQLKAHEIVRCDVPQRTGHSADYARALRECVNAAFDDEVVDRFLTATESRLPPRSQFSFPLMTQESATVDVASTVRLVSPSLAFAQSRAAETHCGRPDLPAYEQCMAMLTSLFDNGELSVSQLSATGRCDVDAATKWCRLMLNEGLVSIRPA